MEYKDEVLLNYIGNRTDFIAIKVQQETKQLRALSSFLLSMKKEVEYFYSAIQKNIRTFRSTLNADNEWIKPFGILIEHVVAMLQNNAKTIGTIIQSLDDCTNKYESHNKKVLAEANKILDKMNNKLKSISKAKEKYFKESKLAMNCDTENAYKSKLKIVEDCKKEYKDLLTNFNISTESEKEKYIKFLEAWKKNEESKMMIIKSSLNLFEDSMREVESVYTDSRLPYRKVLEGFTDSLDLASYLPNGTEKYHLFDKIDFEVPNEDQDDLENDLVKLLPYGINNTDIRFVETEIKNLLADKSILEENKTILMNLVKANEYLLEACEYFAIIIKKVNLTNEDAFNTLSEIAKVILKQLAEHKYPEAGHIAAILNLGTQVSCTTNKTKTYLREAFMNDSIWRYKDVWDRVTEYRILMSLECLETASNEKRKKLEEEKKRSVKRDSSPSLKKAREDIEREASIRRSICFKELLAISLEMAFYSIEDNVGRGVILKYANMFELDFEKLHQILTEYGSAQPIPIDEEPRNNDLLRYSLSKRVMERKRYGYSDSIMVMGMTLKFVYDLKTLVNILLVSKEWNNIFKTKIYRYLLRLYPEKARLPIWRTILCTKGYSELYPTMRVKVLSNFTENSKSLEEIIRVDVIRSFNYHSESYREAIINILKAYAILNPDIEYCQGMNCIAGFFYFLFKDEATSFNMLYTLISNFELTDLFKVNISLLHIYFYQLNRLMAVHVPRLHSHLFAEGINATYFSSPWFITIFTYTFQSTEPGKLPILTLAIFDEFLTKGVRAIFATSLFILEYFEEELLKLNNETALQFIANLYKSEFFFKQKVVDEYKAKIHKYNITEELLGRLNLEYKIIYTVASRREDIVKEPMKPFKYFISYRSPNESRFASVYFSN